MNARIIEIFSSIQGEGLWVGKPQVFVRFHGCRLKCAYCDTPLTHLPHSLELSIAELNKTIRGFQLPSLSLTGGEPLEQADFLQEWLPTLNHQYEILLETNGVETEALKKILSYISIISMDLKLPSATHEKPYWDEHRLFLEIAQSHPSYVKIVYNENMTSEEKKEINDILKSYPDLVAVFQPVSPIQKRDMKTCLDIFYSFTKDYPNRIRLIPQVHKLLSLK